MALTGNKGEWSEVYAFLKLLGEGQVFAGDGDLNKIESLFYPIVKILRRENYGSYDYVVRRGDIIIETPEGQELLRRPASDFLQEAEKLLEKIRKGKGAFAIPETEKFMNSVNCHNLKAKSNDKADIRIVLHDCRTRMNSILGFSIKSQLGGDSTLLNASKATNFTFKVVGGTFSDKDIEEINAINPPREKVLERVKHIRAKGGEFVFEKMDNPTFCNNLVMLDSHLPQIIACLLLEQLNGGSNMIKTLTENIANNNPLGYNTAQQTPFYAYKVKHLLTSSALGLMPATPWKGIYDANGGYLVVKNDGDVLCYHICDRNRFEDYLYYNAYLERASTNRHEYAVLYQEENELYFKLNFQVRLK